MRAGLGIGFLVVALLTTFLNLVVYGSLSQIPVVGPVVIDATGKKDHPVMNFYIRYGRPLAETPSIKNMGKRIIRKLLDVSFKNLRQSVRVLRILAKEETQAHIRRWVHWTFWLPVYSTAAAAVCLVPFGGLGQKAGKRHKSAKKKKR